MGQPVPIQTPAGETPRAFSFPRLRKNLCTCLVALLASPAAIAAVSIVRGPTPIPEGNATGARDITILNEHMAVAFAVGTAPPWGVARGGIIDIAEIRKGRIAPDRAALFDFMPNDWSQWDSRYQRVTVEKETPEEVVLRTERDWNGLALLSTWRLAAGSDTLSVRTEMRNTTDKALEGLLSGYSMWPEGGFLFGVPAESALAHWSAAYDRDWVIGLHAPFAKRIGDDSRDRYVAHDIAPGESRVFEAWLQVGERGETAPLVAREIARESQPAGTLAGTVRSDDGDAVAEPTVFVERETADGPRAFAWAQGTAGRYALQLPTGRYRLRATAEGFGASAERIVELRPGDAREEHFSDLRKPAELALSVVAAGSESALDARISIESGEKPLLAAHGSGTWFTELDRRGQTTLRLAPGEYRLRIAAAEHFRAKASFLNIRLLPGERSARTVAVEFRADPAAEGWYAGDMHHHSNVLDGFTPPEWVLRSQLAAGLDLAMLSDHDAVVNNAPLALLARQRGIPFVAGTELSPSWAHFNAYPLDPAARIGIDVGRSTVQQIFAEARRMGAKVLQVNHPFINYGYFRSQREGRIPGGYSADFDLVEVNGSGDNTQTIRHAWALWNAGQFAWLGAGSDVHDVWHEESGSARMFVQLEGPPDVDSFITALKQGHAYASQGPLLLSGPLPGSEIRHAAGQPLPLTWRLQAVNGLRRVELVERGKVVETRRLAGDPEDVQSLAFAPTPAHDTWYSLVLHDATGRKAWTNPIRIRLQ